MFVGGCVWDEVGDVVVRFHLFKDGDEGSVDVTMHFICLADVLPFNFGSFGGSSVEIDEVGCIAGMERCNVGDVADGVIYHFKFDEVQVAEVAPSAMAYPDGCITEFIVGFDERLECWFSFDGVILLSRRPKAAMISSKVWTGKEVISTRVMDAQRRRWVLCRCLW
jgi:hypothetical protein